MDKVIDYISWVLLVVAILLLRFKSSYLENIIHGNRFVLNYALWGLTFAIVWTFLLYSKRPHYYKGGEKRASAILSLFFAIPVLTLVLSALYTHKTGMEKQYIKSALVLEKSENVRTGRKYIYLLINKKEERFNPSNDEYQKLSKGDSLMLTVGKGKITMNIFTNLKINNC